MQILVIGMDERQGLISQFCYKIQNLLGEKTKIIYQERLSHECEGIINADLIITFNLLGFEQSTLTGGVFYNLLNCKQIHFVLDRNLPNECCLKLPLSIAMFFYCINDEYYEYLLNQYMDIPYLKSLNIRSADERNESFIVNALCNAVCEVLKMCTMYGRCGRHLLSAKLMYRNDVNT